MEDGGGRVILYHLGYHPLYGRNFPGPASGVSFRPWQTVGTWMWEIAADGEECGHPIGKLEAPGEGGGCSP